MNILITDRWHSPSLKKLDSDKFSIRFSETKTPSIEELKDCHFLLIRSRTKVDEQLLNKAKNLKLIVSATSGLDHINLELCQKKNVKVANTANANTQSAAEITLFLMLSLLKKYPLHQKALDNFLWKDQTPLGGEIFSKTIGIIGLGRIGKRVAQLVSAFGAESVIAYDPYISQTEFQSVNAEKASLTDVLKLSDILTLHVPLNSETHHLINSKTIEHCNPDCYLINASRGAVICEDALVKALKKGQFSGVGMDVFEKEPLVVDSPLRQIDRVFYTPHIGGYTQESFQRASFEAISIVEDFVKEKTLKDILTQS